MALFQVGRLKHCGLALTVALMGLLSLAACGADQQSGTTDSAGSSDAVAILQQASHAGYADVTFSLTFTSTASDQKLAGGGSGKLTKSPARAQVSLTLPVTVSGAIEQATVETITDTATSAVYSRTTIHGTTSKWTKASSNNSGTAADVNALTSLTTYQNARLLGSETVNGVSAWHIQANPARKAGATTAARPLVDIYIRQDNHYPVKITSSVSGPPVANLTLAFTAFNTGVTIPLPQV